MTRLRRYIPVLAYFAALFAVVILHDEGVIASEVPGLIVSGFGFCWLIVFIWRNRSFERVEHDRDAERRADIFDPEGHGYYTQGPGSFQTMDR